DPKNSALPRYRSSTTNRARLREESDGGGVKHEFPHPPRHDPVFRSRLVWEHRDVLQQVAVWIAKENGRGWHPGENDRLIGWAIIEVEWHDAGGAQRPRRRNDICEAHPECCMERHSLRRRAGCP